MPDDSDKLVSWHEFYVNNRLKINNALLYDISFDDIVTLVYKNKTELLHHKALKEDSALVRELENDKERYFNKIKCYEPYIRNFLKVRGLLDDPRLRFKDYLIDCFSKGKVPDTKIASELLESIIVDDVFKVRDNWGASHAFKFETD